MSPQERLQKVLASAGLGSRRKCEELIEAGRVKVNGRKAVLGDRVDVEGDTVTVDDVPLDLKREKRYFVLNKPAGYVTTLKDTLGRPTVMSLIKEEGRLFPVGRLDKDTRGLLLITDDGHLAHKVMHPSHGVEKTYVVEVEGRLSRGGLSRLRNGVALEEGITAPAKVKILSRGGKRCLLEITIHEGKKRQIRRMCEAVGLKVVDLVRTRLGSIDLKGLEEGSYRPLSLEELNSLLGLPTESH